MKCTEPTCAAGGLVCCSIAPHRHRGTRRRGGGIARVGRHARVGILVAGSCRVGVHVVISGGALRAGYGSGCRVRPCSTGRAGRCRFRVEVDCACVTRVARDLCRGRVRAACTGHAWRAGRRVRVGGSTHAVGARNRARLGVRAWGACVTGRRWVLVQVGLASDAGDAQELACGGVLAGRTRRALRGRVSVVV